MIISEMRGHHDLADLSIAPSARISFTIDLAARADGLRKGRELADNRNPPLSALGLNGGFTPDFYHSAAHSRPTRLANPPYATNESGGPSPLPFEAHRFRLGHEKEWAD